MQKVLSNTKLIYGCLTAIALAIFIIHYLISGQAVYGDGIGYYAHLHNWVIDQDFDSTNEYKHIYNPENNNSYYPQETVVQIVRTNASGQALNHFSPGPAILLLPFYVLAHIFSLLTGLPSHGYSDIYQLTTGIGAVFYGMVGLYLLEQLINSRLAVLCIFFGSQLLYYGSFDVINSHVISFFLMGLWLTLFTKKTSPLLLGGIAGLIAATRPQDGVIILIWILAIKFNLPTYLNFFSGFIGGFLPLLIHTLVVFQGAGEHTYIKEFVRVVSNPHSINWLGSLIHPTKGLFIVSPLLLFSAIYLLKTFAKQATITKYLALFFLIQVGIITLQGGWSAAAYGGRMYVSSLPLFAFGLAHAIHSIKHPRLFTLMISVLIVMNVFSMARFILTKKTIDGNTGFEPNTLERIEKLLRINRSNQ